ncbi:hypothetical protein ABN028_07955 [Actinopolymorpha sp. B17G11]|uniref:hypothetical protein n=1 Tax=unclassified Actinopolymorpha TaxID=2627063 RepID=UPI0032D94086
MTASPSSDGPGSGERDARWWPAVSVSTAALLDAAAHLVGYHEVSGMPTFPWWTSLGAAALALVAAGLPAPAVRATVLWLGSGSILALSSLPVLPHDLLVIVSHLIVQVSGGKDLFAVDTPWLAVIRHLVVLTAAGAAWHAGVRARRRARGVCPGCGRIESREAAVGGRLARVGGLLAVVAPLPYVWLKLEWATGSTVGLADPDYFDGVTFFTPGFGDTALLGGLGVVVASAMMTVPRQRLVRATLVGIGAIGSVMLVPVGVLGALLLGATLLTVMPMDEDLAIRPWVFTMVYPSFLLWGVGLALATWQYWKGTKPACAHHRDPVP